MKSTFIVNGSNSLVLIPETDAERVLLKVLTSQQNIVSGLNETSVYGMTYGADSIIICTSGSSDKLSHGEKEKTV